MITHLAIIVATYADSRRGPLADNLATAVGIFLISHDIHDVFDLSDRISVMKNGRIVGTAKVGDVTKEEVLGMIILGKCPPGAVPGPGSLQS